MREKKKEKKKYPSKETGSKFKRPKNARATLKDKMFKKTQLGL